MVEGSRFQKRFLIARIPTSPDTGLYLATTGKACENFDN